MSPESPDLRKTVIRKVATRLKFPQLFAVMAGLFIFDMVVPDFVPFVDEILLGLGTALFGLWREKVDSSEEFEEGGERPIKDVTPRAEGESQGQG